LGVVGGSWLYSALLSGSIARKRSLVVHLGDIMGRSGQKFRDKFKQAREQRERARQGKRRFLNDAPKDIKKAS